MGHLSKGFLFHISLDYCRRLLSFACPFLRILGKLMKFECAIGLNGIVWIKTEFSRDTIFITNLILKYNHVKDSDTEEFIKREIDENKFDH
jgi:exosome complex component RRP40